MAPRPVRGSGHKRNSDKNSSGLIRNRNNRNKTRTCGGESLTWRQCNRGTVCEELSVKNYNWREDDSALLAHGEHKALEGAAGRTSEWCGSEGQVNGAVIGPVG